MEAVPSKADPAVAGGPVSLPSQAAVLHGVRSGLLSHLLASVEAAAWRVSFTHTVLLDVQSI